eukprot:jgi/Psemu1/15455/gm1.15455_g
MIALTVIQVGGSDNTRAVSTIERQASVEDNWRSKDHNKPSSSSGQLPNQYCQSQPDPECFHASGRRILLLCRQANHGSHQHVQVDCLQMDLDMDGSIHFSRFRLQEGDGSTQSNFDGEGDHHGQFTALNLFADGFDYKL